MFCRKVFFFGKACIMSEYFNSELIHPSPLATLPVMRMKNEELRKVN